MRYTTFLIAGMLLFGCGPTQEQIESRKALSQNVRQVNAVFQNISDDVEQEGNMARIQLPSFYEGNIEDLNEVRSALVSVDLVEPYRQGRSELDSVLTLTKATLKERKDVMSALFDASGSISDYARNMKLAQNADYSSNRIDWYNDASDAKEEYGQAVENISEERRDLDQAARTLVKAAREFNAYAVQHEIVDTLRGSEKIGRYSKEIEEAITSIDALELP